MMSGLNLEKWKRYGNKFKSGVIFTLHFQSISKGSSILIGYSIFVFPGEESGDDKHPIQRVDFDDEKIVTTKVIGNNPGYRVSPVLVQTIPGQCVTN